jgi:hypothetical protein
LTSRLIVLVIVLAYLIVLLGQGYDLPTAVLATTTAAGVARAVAPVPKHALSG